jgi:hypothetical protein
VGNNFKQPEQSKQLGGITGRGFLPCRSGNVNGRPKTNTGLVNAIRAKVAELGPDGRTIAQHFAAMLVDESLRGRHRVAAASVILDRLGEKNKEGRHVGLDFYELLIEASVDINFRVARHGMILSGKVSVCPRANPRAIMPISSNCRVPSSCYTPATQPGGGQHGAQPAS